MNNHLKLIILGCTIFGILSMGAVGFINRQEIVEHIVGNKFAKRIDGIPLQITKKSQQDIKQLVNKNPNLIGANVILANFVVNTRRGVYHSFDNEKIQTELDLTKGVAYPLFTNDVYQNSRIKELINGKFVCTTVDKIITVHNIPALYYSVHYVCSVPIPSGTSDFTGWINFFYDKEPTHDEIIELKVHSKAIVNHMYHRDLTI